MKLLLDTQILLWVAGQPERLPEAARRLLSSRENELFFSAASIWEVGIKKSLGRDDFLVEPQSLRDALIAEGFIELPITSEHGVRVASLPRLHKDPFDRILLAQALTEGMILITTDERLAKYPGPVQKV